MRCSQLFFISMFFFSVTVTGNALAVERTETVECELANGDHFILRAKHQWYPVAIFVRHAEGKSKQEQFKVYYRARATQELVYTGADLEHQYLYMASKLEELCASLGLYENQPGTGESLRMPEEKRFWVVARTGVEEGGSSNPGSLVSKLKQRGLTRSTSTRALAIKSNRLVREIPLLGVDATDCFDTGKTGDCIVQAVVREVSTDRGENWQQAGIETSSFFYAVGTALSRQPGIARPTARTIRNFRNSDEGRDEPFPNPCPTKCRH